MYNFYLMDAGEVPHRGAILDRWTSCLHVLPQESSPAGRGHLPLPQFPVDLPSVHESDAVITETDLGTLVVVASASRTVPCDFFCLWLDGTQPQKP